MVGWVVLKRSRLKYCCGWVDGTAVVGLVRVRALGGMAHLVGNRCTVAQFENELFQCKKRDGQTHTLTVPLLL